MSSQLSPDQLPLSTYKVSNTTLALLFLLSFLAAVLKIIHTENQALVAREDKIKYLRCPRQPCANFMFTFIVKIPDCQGPSQTSKFHVHTHRKNRRRRGPSGTVQPGLHISRKDRKHRLKNMFLSFPAVAWPLYGRNDHTKYLQSMR